MQLHPRDGRILAKNTGYSFAHNQKRVSNVLFRVTTRFTKRTVFYLTKRNQQAYLLPSAGRKRVGTVFFGQFTTKNRTIALKFHRIKGVPFKQSCSTQRYPLTEVENPN